MIGFLLSALFGLIIAIFDLILLMLVCGLLLFVVGCCGYLVEQATNKENLVSRIFKKIFE